MGCADGVSVTGLSRGDPAPVRGSGLTHVGRAKSCLRPDFGRVPVSTVDGYGARKRLLVNDSERGSHLRDYLLTTAGHPGSVGVRGSSPLSSTIERPCFTRLFGFGLVWWDDETVVSPHRVRRKSARGSGLCSLRDHREPTESLTRAGREPDLRPRLAWLGPQCCVA